LAAFAVDVHTEIVLMARPDVTNLVDDVIEGYL
jgi:hypothetical protein